MKVALLTAAFAAPVVAVALPVAAQDAAGVSAKIASATAAVRSFSMAMHVSGTTGVDAVSTFVAPMRVKSETRIGGLTVEVYLIDKVLYMHLPTGNWQKASIDQAQANRSAMSMGAALKTAQSRLLPDRVENGRTVGVIETDAQIPTTMGPAMRQALQKLVCSYDKATYLLARCTNSLLSMTYSRYNDSANVVELPAAAQNATTIVLPVPPAPAGSASPAAAMPPPAAMPPGTDTPAPAGTPAGSPSPAESPSPAGAAPRRP